uniref:Complex 1 LYR protein domain-containing protein n=1 Tax=Globisporangium ultimum (strain ATCC 200006 / CBS 805.95 / DAOM BR144) TaxID=431595 RepID=K3X7L4_GLOUD
MAEARALYRRVLRVARTWEGGYVEQQWIRREARTRFEEQRAITDARRIRELVQAGHDQVDVALHYQIPYPRPHYVDPGTVGGDNDFRRRSTRSNTSLGRTSKRGVQKQFQPRHK